MNEFILNPLKTLAWVPRDTLKPNDYNPNKVVQENLRLLTISIFRNGWTLPIVARHDGIIIDGFHRWMVAGPEWTYKPKGEKKTLFELLEGMVPRVIVEHSNESEDIAGTITHNRARGTHLLDPMKAIVKRLFEAGKTVDEIATELGMKNEEVFRLSDISREQFLDMMIKSHEFSKAMTIVKY